MNRPSVESSDLTTTRNIVPHTTSLKREKAGSVGDQGTDAREGRRRALEKHKVSDSGEEGE